MNEELETALSEIKRQLMFNDWTNPEFDFQDLITNLNLLSGDTEDGYDFDGDAFSHGGEHDQHQ